MAGQHAPRTHAVGCDPGEEDGGVEGGARRVVTNLPTEKRLPAEVVTWLLPSLALASPRFVVSFPVLAVLTVCLLGSHLVWVRLDDRSLSLSAMGFVRE